MSSPQVVTSAAANYRVRKLTLSSGGAWTFSGWINLVLRQVPRPAEGSPLPPLALVFDCSPGSDELRPYLVAIVEGVRNHLVKALMITVFVTGRFLHWLVLVAILRRRGPLPGTIARVKMIIAEGNILPWSSKTTTHLFVHAKNDPIVPASAVESFTAELQAKGMTNIKRERFDGARHVRLIESEPQRYWTLVRGAWEEAASAAGKDHSEGVIRTPLARL